MLPRIRVTDLLSEVAGWTLFTECFTHLRSGETVADPRVLMASLLADGLNLGLTRMAEACTIASLGQLAWMADWHIRDETYALALRCLVDHQQREPLAAIFGGGSASSSDGQFFRAGGFGRDAGRVNAHYGDDPGSKFYTHLSDRYAPFHTKVIAATASEALHVLDGLLYHQSDVTVRRHHTDGGGDAEHVFALLALLGFQFAPRIPDLKSRRIYSFAKSSAYPTLEPLIAGRINVALIRTHWAEILRVAASIRTGTVTASLIMRQLASYPRQNGVAAALRELGRLERTLFTLDWLEDPELRWQTSRELNKGESRNSPGARRLHPSARGNSRPHLRKSAASRLRPEPPRHRDHPVEHPLFEPRHRRLARGRRRPRPPSRSPVAPWLGARQSDRRLYLVSRPEDGER
jgi:TnpA family transposase